MGKAYQMRTSRSILCALIPYFKNSVRKSKNNLTPGSVDATNSQRNLILS